jgi:DNA-binding HxlR family transcriptional regulator
VRRLAATITRQLRLLRAHGVVQKISKTHRYKLTPRGQLLTAALFAAREATLTQLIGHAA